MDVSTIITQLAAPEGFPKAALLAATEQREEMAKRFIAEIEAYIDGRCDYDAEDAVFFMFHLLGEWRETTAYPVLMRLLRLPPETIDRILGYAITETSHRVITAVFDGNPQPIYDFIHDENADEFLRSSMLHALAMLVHEGKIERSAVAGFLRDCFTDLKPQDTNYVWFGWQNTIAVLGMDELTPLVKQAFDREYVEAGLLGFGDYVDDLKQALDDAEAPFSEGVHHLHPFESVIDELEDWNRSETERDASFWEDDNSDWETRAPNMSGFDPYNKVGRNDPCPCGSGKKFKKCCLQ